MGITLDADIRDPALAKQSHRRSGQEVARLKLAALDIDIGELMAGWCSFPSSREKGT